MTKKKTPAKRAAKKITREMWVARRHNDCEMVNVYRCKPATRIDVWGDTVWGDTGYLTSFCMAQAKQFFDLHGMKRGTARKFRITTEVVDEPKRKPTKKARSR